MLITQFIGGKKIQNKREKRDRVPMGHSKPFGPSSPDEQGVHPMRASHQLGRIPNALP